MENLGTIFYRGRRVYIQRDGRQLYVSGSPVEQHPRDLRDMVIDHARESEIKTAPQLTNGE